MCTTETRRPHGFTIIELLIAFVLIALLVILGMPSFARLLRDSEIRSTAESVVNGLRVARSEGLRRNLPVKFALVGGAGSASWIVTQVKDNSMIQTYSRNEGGTNTTLAVLPAPAVSVSFDGLGRIMPAAVASNPNLGQLDISSALAPSSHSLRVYVDDARGIRLCDPSPALAALTPPDARAC